MNYTWSCTLHTFDVTTHNSNIYSRLEGGSKGQPHPYATKHHTRADTELDPAKPILEHFISFSTQPISHVHSRTAGT